ncbi:helix-turn-helix domain-containing protein [Bradyrhizobium guangdongense]|uniref:DNA-binding protein n=1 Tax=Bradyrhizobium guangdongense TaxID=1325090 RepID=A0ABX6UPJ6_9BRAD|nr:helix-turn-helix domain-containing protein [Bradyrhizobium guangdongense]QAU42208.1 DNA-binding protein [Bradyrhizobium guangdongense]QOZ63267.1 DNA-binding protein [Bradyrhizobium guangdongense]
MSIDITSRLELLTVVDVAKILRISIATVRRLQQQRRIPFLKVGGRVRFIRRDVDAYLQNRRVPSIDA